MPYVYDSAPHSHNNHRDVITSEEVRHWVENNCTHTHQTRVYGNKRNEDIMGWEIKSIRIGECVGLVLPLSGNIRYYYYEESK